MHFVPVRSTNGNKRQRMDPQTLVILVGFLWGGLVLYRIHKRRQTARKDAPAAPQADTAAGRREMPRLGEAGTNGTVLFDLGDPTSPIVVTWNPTGGQVDELLDGNLYVSIDSATFPSGEIRGQIVQDCRTGTVDLTGAGPADVLFVNGSAGGASRTVTVAEGELIWIVMLVPPA